jgi:zeaxanthin glucosyltransferase
MAVLGAFCFPGTGHLNPMTTLARRLESRGHRVIFFGIADVEQRVSKAGLEFRQIGAQDYPPGTLLDLDLKLSRLKGLPSFSFTIERIRNHAAMVMRDGPAAVRAAGVEAMLVDEAEMAGTVADYLGLPFVSIACIPPLVRDYTIPPFVFGWGYSTSVFGRLRNRAGVALLERVAAPIFADINTQRVHWGLPRIPRGLIGLSYLARIAQLPAALEFPIRTPQESVYYTGPFVDADVRPQIDFPWEKLNGKPLVYGSIGTLQNGAEHIFKAIAAACAMLDVQLVLSMGGGIEPAELGPLPGTPIVVRYAPQLELLQRAAVVVTHAGLNTTLEALAEGVPLVAIPIGNDQPGVASRIAYRRAGVVVPSRKLKAERLRRAIEQVLSDPSYRANAQRIQASIREANGLERAADLVEQALNLAPAESAMVAAEAFSARASDLSPQAVFFAQ